jgi:starch synthase
MGSDKIDKKITDEIKPSKTKKVIKFEQEWKEDITPLLDLYKSLTES